MCYSAMVEQNLKTLMRRHQAKIDLAAFDRLFTARINDDRIKIPKAMEANFLKPESDQEASIAEHIQAWHPLKTQELEAGLFKQKKRLADAERKLQLKETKAAANDKRIAATKIDWHLQKIADLNRTELKPRDARIFPQIYAPVIVFDQGKKLIRPMRYLLRRAGKPASDDLKYPGCYNARRNNLEAYWKNQFGHTHGILQIDSFYENVARHTYEHRELKPGEAETNLVLHFNPKPPQPMLVACLWSHWQLGNEPALDSFAAITDEPPPEVADAGHDRCVVQLKPENVDAWLDPVGKGREALFALMDDRQLPYYEHQMAA